MLNRILIALVLTALTLTALAPNTLAQTTAPASPSELREMAPANAPASLEPSSGAGVPAAAASQPADEPAPGQKPGKGPFGDNYIMFVMLGGIILLYIWMGRGRRKRENERKQMLSNLKKGDKVTSIGGIIGTVIEVKEDEVTVKVDETNNVRMKFARWAIRGVGETAVKEGKDA